MIPKTKSRNLSPFEFIQALTQEYLIAEFRGKIFVDKKDKDYQEKLMLGKKEKIVDLSGRNYVDTIFNDAQTKILRYGKFYPMYGMPSFEGMTINDIACYYQKGSDVRVKIGEFKNVGKIVDCDVVDSKILVSLSNGNEKWVDMRNIGRIL